MLTLLPSCSSPSSWRPWGDRTRSENRVYRIDGRDDMRLIYRDYGPHDAPLTLVLLHGAASSKYSWAHVADRLADRYRVILIDLLGHGDSSKPLDYPYSMSDHGRIIRDFIRAQRLGPVVLFGMSYGGGVALETSRLYFESPQPPNPVAGLVLVAPAAYTFPPPPQYLKLRAWWMPLAIDLAPSFAVVNYSVDARYHDPRRCKRECRMEHARVLHDRTARKIGRNVMVAAMEELELRENEMQRYKHIDCPALVLWGDDDKVVSPFVREKLVSGLGRPPTTIVIPNCGHAVCEEQPDRAMPFINDLLTRVAAPRFSRDPPGERGEPSASTPPRRAGTRPAAPSAQ